MLLLTIMPWAFANGQSTHCWISEQAIVELSEGDLKQFLLDADLEVYWRNGTMFPDGGYAVGDDYGEIAHWEPFQKMYLSWIKDNYSPPWSDEASAHIAFLLGMASHGMADQSFDAMYFRRAYVYDQAGNWSVSLDEATDVTFIADTEPQPVPEKWTPSDIFVELFSEQGHQVEASTMESGQTLLQVAVQWVGSVATNLPERVAEYRQDFPWATANMLNEDYSGSPPIEAKIIASYWEYLWAELHDQPPSELVLFVSPSDRTYAHPVSSEDIEADVSIVFAQGLNTELLTEDMIAIIDAEGNHHPIGVDVFYGHQSNVVNVTPLIDWNLGEYTLHISAALPFRDGSTLSQEFTSRFSTETPDTPYVESDKETSRGCSQPATDRPPWWTLFLVLLFGVRKRGCSKIDG